MKIVIEIDEDAYRQIRNWGIPTDELRRKIYDIIDNGTPLPKHHGDLVDRDAIEVLRIGNIKREYDKGFDAGVTCMVNRILDAPTVIERSESE